MDDSNEPHSISRRNFLKLSGATTALALLPKLDVFAPEPIVTVERFGRPLAEYMNTMVEKAGHLDHIRLASPAFNMSSELVHPIIDSMTKAGANWQGLHAIAGNAYQIEKTTPSHWVHKALKDTPLQNMPIIITETGLYSGSFGQFSADIKDLQDGRSKYGNRVMGVLLYNGFNTNPDWSKYALTDEQIRQIGGSSPHCLGINSANPYPQSPNEGFYDHAKALGLRYSLEIFSGPNETNVGVVAALSRNITPIIRIGTEHTGGPAAADFANYLISLDQKLTSAHIKGQVLAIAGPNEPETEKWLTSPS